LIDGLGALLSAFLLGVVLVRFQSLVGIPIKTLYFLAILPCFFAVYDLFCYFFAKSRSGGFLKGIAIINVLYCLLSLGLAFSHQEVMTGLGWLYIIVEIIIVLFIASIEWKASTDEVSA